MAAFDRFNLGSSYYPEQWSSDRWEEDFRKMRELGFNSVRMGEFAWAFFEPNAGTFNFEWMDQAIELAHHYGVATILCTPTASVPPWLRQQHPDVLGGNEKGPFDYGARKGYCTNSPAMLAAADRVVTAMAAHYGANPHIIGWQLDNEPGYPFVCYDANCLRAFRAWLQQRYGTLEALNTAWGGAFWSHMYTDWEQIEFPLNNPDGTWDPGQRLDYRRFYADSFTCYLSRQAAILRQHIGDRFIFTNWPNACWSVDVFEMAHHLDCTGWDNYIPNPGVTDHREQYFSGLNHDICRCAGPNQRFLVSEQSSQVAAHALSEGVRLQTYIDLAHGASGTIFFEWRPPVGGAEQGYMSVLQMDGSFGPAYAQHKQLGEELGRLGPELADATTDADIAMLYSYTNEWHQGFWMGKEGYDSEFDRYYRGIKSLQRNVDVVPPSAPLEHYRLVVAPGLQIVTEDEFTRLRAYVEAGGILVLNMNAGTRDSFNRLRELITPGLFGEMAGINVPARVTAKSMSGNLILGAEAQKLEGGGIRFAGDNETYTPATTLERITLHGAEPVATFVGGRMTDVPAVTVNAYGQGYVVYVGTDSYDPRFYDRLAALLRDRFAIAPLFSAPFGVEVVSRQTATNEYIFLMNLTELTHQVTLPTAMREAISEEILHDALTLGPLDVKILVRPRG